MLKHCSVIMRGGIVMGSVYLVCSVSISSQTNLDIRHGIAGWLRNYGKPVILGGDGQDPPSTMQKTGWLDLIDAVIATPAETTCNVRCIDYFVISRSISHLVHNVRIIADRPWNAAASAQHAPVRLLIDASMRAMSYGASRPRKVLRRHFHTARPIASPIISSGSDRQP